jgi:hypothetical protein
MPGKCRVTQVGILATAALRGLLSDFPLQNKTKFRMVVASQALEVVRGDSQFVNRQRMEEERRRTGAKLSFSLLQLVIMGRWHVLAKLSEQVP